MNRTNLTLLVVLLALAGIWAARRDWGGPQKSTLPPRMFPDFNKEAADRIEISGGWLKDTFTIKKTGTAWELESHGGYDVRGEEANAFLDAVASLRKQNETGTSEKVREATRTDKKNGRLVTVFQGSKPILSFRVGKSPKGWGQDVFIRIEDEESVYRVRTIRDGDTLAGMDPLGNPIGARPFDWHNYTFKVYSKWLDGKVWALGAEEAHKIWLTRKDLDAKFVKNADDDWDLIEKGKDPVKADTDATDSILSQLRNLYHVGVAGRYEDVREELGFNDPGATLILEMRKKVEKKEEEKPADEGDEKDDEKDGDKEGDEKDKKPKEPEYVTIKRVVEVGQKVKRIKEYDRETFDLKTEEVYPIRVSTDSEDGKNLETWVFFVNDYTVGALKKAVEEFRREEPADEEGDKDGDGGEGNGDGAIKKPGGGTGDKSVGDKGNEPGSDDDSTKKEDGANKKEDGATKKEDESSGG